MSVVPLRISDTANASSKPRDPRGTVNIPYGYRLSQHRQTRPNVNLTYGKQSRLPGGDTSLRTEYPSNHDKRELPSEKHSMKNEFGKSMRAKDVTKNEKGEPLRVTDSSNKAKEGSLLRAKYSAKKEKEGSLLRAKYSPKKEERVSILPVDPTASNDDDNVKEDREYNNFLRTSQFVERTNKRILRNKIGSLVDEGMAMYEERIDARREKLRSLILAEEKYLMIEIIDQAQRGADLRMNETLQRTEELRKRLEEQRVATVTEKRMRQYLAQCPEARNKFTRKTTLETKYSNLVQIAENEAKREAESEVDVLWYELMLKEVEAKKAREMEEEKRRAAAGKSIVATLEKQIAGKLALCEEENRVKEEERENLERFREMVRKEELSNPAREREKRVKLKRDLDEQSAIAKRFLVERAREEEAMERTFRVLGEAELSRERATKMESTSRLRDEIVAYMASIEKLREEEARRNAEVETIVAATVREVEHRRDLAKKKSREDRERAQRECLEGREQQLRAKRAIEEEKYKRAALNDESRRKETETEASLEAEAEKKRREIARRYGQELKDQQKYATEMRRRENEKIERMHRDDLEREKEYEKLAEQMLNAPEIITPHAFKVLLKECADRREAKQKGLCYSSRSSAQLQPTPSTSYP